MKVQVALSFLAFSLSIALTPAHTVWELRKLWKKSPRELFCTKWNWEWNKRRKKNSWSAAAELKHETISSLNSLLLSVCFIVSGALLVTFVFGSRAAAEMLNTLFRWALQVVSQYTIWSARGLHTWSTTAVPNCHNATRVCCNLINYCFIAFVWQSFSAANSWQNHWVLGAEIRLQSSCYRDQCHHEQFLISSQDSIEGESRCALARLVYLIEETLLIFYVPMLTRDLRCRVLHEKRVRIDSRWVFVFSNWKGKT